MKKSIRNFISLTIRAYHFTYLADKPILLEKLRGLTLHGYSGMNAELDYLIHDCPVQPPEAHIILAYRSGILVGWALLTNENSGNFDFLPEDGYMFQVFVAEEHRRTGIANALFKRARKLVKEDICVVPWSEEATDFYDQCNLSKVKYLNC